MTKNWKRNETVLKQHCSCEYSLIHEGTTVSEEDTTLTTEDGRMWKLVKMHDDCRLHGEGFDLPDGIM